MLWLAEDSADTRHHIHIEHVDLSFAYSARNQRIQFQVQFSWSYVYKEFRNANLQENVMGQALIMS